MGVEIEAGSPSSWGIPEKFVSFRGEQLQAVLEILNGTKRHRGGSIPVGGGKSLDAVMLHKMLPSRRTAILTATKGLMDQYDRDFSSMGLRVIKGRNSYTCELDDGYGDKVNCEIGALRRCRYQTPTPEGLLCDYERDLRAVMSSELVVTNYHYWIAAHRYGRGLGDFDLLVMDEAHDAPTILSDFAAVTLNFGYDVLPMESKWEDKPAWRKWAARQLPVSMPNPETEPVEYLKRKAYERKLEVLAKLPDSWSIDKGRDKFYFNPLWPSSIAQDCLFLGAKVIVALSATVRPQTMKLLGVEDFDFFDQDSAFLPSRAPIRYLTTSQRLRYGMSQDEKTLWMSSIDNIIRSRLGWKGIIHTVSYARAQEVMRLSRHSKFMIGHDGAVNLQEVVERFKAMPPPAILVSPSLGTGYDFPFEDARWQIIAKVPFADNQETPNLAKARRVDDPVYEKYLIAQSLIQMVGRVMRDEKDFGETWIVDKQFGWFGDKNRDLFPPWFWKRLKYEKYVSDAEFAI